MMIKKNREKPLEQPGRKLQIEISGDDIDRGDDEDAANDERGPGLLEESGRGVKQDGDNENVDKIGDPHVGKRPKHIRGE